MRLRLLSAVVLAPGVVVLVVLGGWAFAALVAAGLALLAHEWDRLTGGSGTGPAALALGAVLLLVVLLAAAGEPGLAAMAVGGGAAAAAAVAWREGRRPAWPALGALWFGLPALAMLWLRLGSPHGLAATLWLLVLVWACDSGAYVAGRSIGGPKLAPRVSPKKTWAGLAGGLAAAAAASAVLAAWTDIVAVPLLTAAGVLVALLSQLGDLAESAVKRHFQVKDSGALIPGHGGLFDRVDALLFAAPAAALLALWYEGLV